VRFWCVLKADLTANILGFDVTLDSTCGPSLKVGASFQC
jgi:hypothetical protein